MKEALRRLDISPDEFGSKLVEHLNKTITTKYNHGQSSKFGEKLAIAAMAQRYPGRLTR